MFKSAISNQQSAISSARRLLALYNAFFPVVFLLLLPGYLLRMIRRGNFRAHFGQRLGRYAPELQRRLAGHRWTWIQSISVGETLIALKLARELRAQDPAIHIVLSVTTTTGFALAEENASDWLLPIYNPIDLRPIARRAVAAIQPERLLVIEGGVWPNLLAGCVQAGAKAALVNARMSPRSERRFRRFRRFIGPIFRLFAQVLVPEEEERARWQALGVEPSRIQVTGSIKFDQPPAGTSRAEEFRGFIGKLGISAGAPVVVAGSTFPGEEKLLVEALPALRARVPGLFLILVPRHVERTPAILRELAPLPVRIHRRTSAELPPGAPDVLLVDTTGELRDWYALATVAFIGKSITETGGQNPAEPAVLGKPVVFGPHMENFAALAQHLVARGAAVQVANGAALGPALGDLLTDAARRSAMSAAASTALWPTPAPPRVPLRSCLHRALDTAAGGAPLSPMENQWTDVDAYLAGQLVPSDAALEAALAESDAAGLPQISVAPNQGKFLHLLARMAGARRILELGTLGGYSTLWLARALPPGGRLVTLEADERHAAVARRNFERAGLSEAIDLRVGRALDTLPQIAGEAGGPFDFIFIDADKENIPAYFDWAVRLSRPGTVIIVDNVIRQGGILDPNHADARVQGVRKFYDSLRSDTRVSATALQTVGSKGYDGFALALVTNLP